MFTSKIIRFVSTAALAVGFSTVAHAQATRTWVSGVGDDANPCSRTAPCKTFAGAISKTATGGEINCLDSGGFGSVTITKSITIKCEGCIGGLLSSFVNGIVINDSGSGTPNTAIVTISGLDIEGAGTGINGISFFSGAALHVHKTQIRNFTNNGISITPSAGTAKITVADSYITDNGSAISNAGILVRPTGGSSVNLSVDNTKFEGNTNGIFMDGSGGAGPSNTSVNHSVLTTSSSNGIAVASASAAFTAVLDSTMISLNAGVGAATAGGGAKLLLGGNTITANVTGVSNSGGTLQSFKNNEIAANGSDGTPITAVPGGPLN
jgi:hypothetical protein